MTNSLELNELVNLLSSKKEKLIAMLAPAFPVDFSYPEIVGMLKRIGFSYVVEVAMGAVETNKQVIEELKKDPKKRIIASPCPSCVKYIAAQYPDLVKFLSQADSPMRATAKLVLEKYPDAKPVFIGPCLTKKLEAKEHPELNILVVTFKELAEIFQKLEITNSTEDLFSRFDLLGPETRLYPISGGLCQSAGIDEFLAEDQYQMVSGIENLNETLKDFIQNKNIRLLDILFCEGGCIGGPGTISKESVEPRRHKVIKYWASHLPAK